MKTLKLLTAVGLISLLGACATQPRDTSGIDAKINRVTSGDVGQFMHHQTLAAENLAEARKLRQWMKDDHYWNIDLAGHADAAAARALKHRQAAESSLAGWHDRCERHPNYCIAEELLAVAYFPTGSHHASRVKKDVINRITELARIHHPLEVEVIAYTDTVGSKSSNFALAKRRANSVHNMLHGKDIHAHTTIKETPIGEASGPDNTKSQKNRRVDIKVRRYQPFPK
ncbi:MAG: OmpA family protein [Methylococcaceae bacterium]|nr:OmpA family protein [Methylococcaceae bacterium]